MFKALIPLWIAFGSILSGCPYKNDKELKKQYSIQIDKIGQLPEYVLESSGLAFFPPNTFFTHPDSGNDPILIQFQLREDKIENVKEIKIANTLNKDWEELARDDKGNIYLGDFGNNANLRRDMVIYVIDTSFDLKSTLHFEYPDQKEFPPTDKDELNFDCEAFFWMKDHLYFFSKNRRYPYTKIYQMNLETNSIKLIDSLLLKSPITGADVRNDFKEAVLLTYGKIFFIDISHTTDVPKFTHGYCQKFKNSGQSEAITYITDNELIISNEKGKIYRLTRKGYSSLETQ